MRAMLNCSGQGILIELAEHLKIPQEFILSNLMNIPRAMPQLAASLLTWASGNRPSLMSEKMINLAVVDRFAEIPNKSCATADHSVCGAHTAVNRSVGLQEA